MRPLRVSDVPRPRHTKSGLFPAATAPPDPPAGAALRARRAVALTVVVGTLCLLAYASWKRVAHGLEPSEAPRAQPR
jgi:hypothetical protein